MISSYFDSTLNSSLPFSMNSEHSSYALSFRVMVPSQLDMNCLHPSPSPSSRPSKSISTPPHQQAPCDRHGRYVAPGCFPAVRDIYRLCEPFFHPHPGPYHSLQMSSRCSDQITSHLRTALGTSRQGILPAHRRSRSGRQRRIRSPRIPPTWRRRYIQQGSQRHTRPLHRWHP